MAMRHKRITVSGSTPVRLDSSVSGQSIQFTPNGDVYIGGQSTFDTSGFTNCRVVSSGFSVAFEGLGTQQDVIGIWIAPVSGSVTVDISEWNIN